MAGLAAIEEVRPHPTRHGKHSDHRDRLLPAQRCAVARTPGSSRWFALGCRKPASLGSQHLHEDKTRNRDDNTAYNLAVLRHMAFNLMQRDRSRVSLRSKFNLAAWKEGVLGRAAFINLKRPH